MVHHRRLAILLVELASHGGLIRVVRHGRCILRRSGDDDAGGKDFRNYLQDTVPLLAHGVVLALRSAPVIRAPLAGLSHDFREAALGGGRLREHDFCRFT
ncbi:hypothetical protein [Methylosinus sp. sav-2]|uniref:hypothetical protein n=1 Tax=Methylosinus sp. sav-2 TaxID=2485168 RepID=UPI001066F996|nr:hypothetical protein [Methylosinus sp. sav-2]